MPVRRIVRDGEVTATPGTIAPDAAAPTGGAWTAGGITYSTDRRISNGGKPAATKAECTFTFTGPAKSGNSTVTDSSKVTLPAGVTALRIGGASLLREGDSETDRFGNMLKGTPAGPLRSA